RLQAGRRLSYADLLRGVRDAIRSSPVGNRQEVPQLSAGHYMDLEKAFYID
ncbi:hypothetical protein HK405_015542, partial [Cladochytrium tenue]